MQTNQAPVWDLAGRETEMSALAQSFDRVRKGTGPQGVTILADSGVGKTRLLVEFFSQLVRHHDKNGYWPAALPQDPAALELNPRLGHFRWSETGPGNPGFWWWALRFSDPGQRNTTVSRAGAIATYAPELLPHFAFLEHKNVLVADKKGALDLGIDVLMEFGPALLGAAVPGLGLMKPILVKAVESHRIRQDLAKMMLDAPGGAERDAHESVRASLAVRLLTLQDILGVPALDAARSAVKHASGVLELDRAAFRAALPLRWQARWLLRRATDHTLRVTADSATFLELIDAATSTLRTSVEALSKDSTWQGAEAVSNAATAMVSMTLAAISQAGINGNTEFDETELLDETKLLDAAAHCLESGISSLLGLGSVEVAARCAMLDGLAEAAPRGTSSHHRNQAWDRLVTDLLALVQADDWSEASASLLFEGPFETALLAWPHWERSRDSYRIAQALCSATAGQPLEALGNFQLALRALALFRVCGTQVDSIEDDLASTEDCNFELINRGMAPLVHKYTWVSQVSVRVAAGTSQAVPIPEFTSQERLSLAWTAATKTLTRLFDAEVKMSVPVLVRLCERTLRPVAELYLPPRSEHAKGLAEFVGRVHALSPNSGCAPLVAAAYAWWTQASNLISASDGLTAQQLRELRFAAFEAVSLVPRRVFAALSDYDRDFKASEPFLKDLAQVPERLDREALLAQAAVACIDCRSYYSVDDFTEVTWRNLMAVFSKAAGDRASDGCDPQEPCALGQLALNLVKRFKPHDDQCSEALLVELDEFRSLALASRMPR